MKSKYIVALLALTVTCQALSAKLKVKLTSPDKKITVSFREGDKLYYSIMADKQVLFEDNSTGLAVEGDPAAAPLRLKSIKKASGRSAVTPVVPLKFKSIDCPYNQVTIAFKNGISAQFRAYNDGVAYRLLLDKGAKEVNIDNEEAVLNLASDYLIHYQPESNRQFRTSYEEAYKHRKLSEWQKTGKYATLPLLIDTQKEYKILISESGLDSYPCLFLTPDGGKSLKGIFPKVPSQYGADGDRSLKIQATQPYIARVKGQRALPWRYFEISKNDGDIAENTFTARLAKPNLLKDVSWIKPGQVTWEWWNGAAPYGPDVNFKTGINQATYQYYIDFAAKNHIGYILLDEGWAKSTEDPFDSNPDLNIPELVNYGKAKNVGVILWLPWLTVDRHMDLFAKYAAWGVKGVKIDFMDRSDQWMVDFYRRVAAKAAENHLMVDFHGAFTPAGLEYEYPNVVSYEGVRGMEQMSGCTPDNSLYLPFMRNAVGAMDFTPGAMTNMQPEVYCSTRPNSAAIGTRCYQMALYVVFESGWQMLADGPTQYMHNPECTDFITQVPVVWDETRVLAAKIGQYIVVAKRSGNKWFVGAITNNALSERSLNLKMDFLPKGKSCSMTDFEDGINADRQAMDYRKSTQKISSDQTITIRLARNGGWAAVIE